MTPWQAIVLGVVEGLTEYLPVSSTGHLCLAQSLMGIGDATDTKEAADAYAIAIQLGAILAVAWLYWGRVRQAASGLTRQHPEGRRLLVNVAIAFAPAAATGLLLEPLIKAYLFGLWPIAAAWFVGGVVLLVPSRLSGGRPQGGREMEDLQPRQALVIGAAQLVAMWPGVSRSLVTIVAGTAVGLSTAAAVEFSFLLGLVTLGAATCAEMALQGHEIVRTFGLGLPLLGLAVALVSAAAAVKWMVAYVSRHGLRVFGYYRVALGVAVAAWLLAAR